MGFMTRIARHMDLMGAMFNRTGAMGGKMVPSSLEPQFAQAAMRCAGCRETGACAQFLETAEPGCAAPVFCANAPLIEQLRQYG